MLMDTRVARALLQFVVLWTPVGIVPPLVVQHHSECFCDCFVDILRAQLVR